LRRFNRHLVLTSANGVAEAYRCGGPHSFELTEPGFPSVPQTRSRIE
jgi:hypothetical protein